MSTFLKVRDIIVGMIEPNLRYQKNLEQYIAYWESLNRRSVSLLSSLVDTGFAFQDPYHSTHGAQHAEAVVAHRLFCCERLSMRVSDFAWGQHAGRGYMFWEATYDFKKRQKLRIVELKDRFSGVSELLFSSSGRVAAHQDFWGGHANFDVARYSILDF